MPDQRQPDGDVPDRGTGGSTAVPAGPASDPGRAPGAAHPGRAWMVPAVTFVAGLFLGAVVTGANTGSPVEQQVGPAATEPTPSPGASPAAPASPGDDVTVAVPRSCLEVASRADELAVLVRDAAVAAGQLDAARLSVIVRELEGSQTGLDVLSGECRAGADPLP